MAIGSSTAAAAPGECTCPPSGAIVHDPTPHGALAVLAAERDRESLQRRYLFRDWPEPSRFAAQHRTFVKAIEDSGVTVHRLADLLAGDPALEPAAVNSNQVYTRDAVVTFPWLPGAYLLGRMHAPIRRPERETMAAAMARLGLRPLAELPPDLVLEGGDVIPFAGGGRRRLLVGYGRRTQRETIDFLRDALIPEHLDEIVGVRLAPWRINLDGGMVPVTEDLVVAHPESLLDGVLVDAGGSTPVDVLDLLRELGVEVVEVSREESIYQQACNFLCLGERRAVCYDLTPRLLPLLAAREVNVVAVPGSELVKGTGGPRCMSRPIYA